MKSKFFHFALLAWIIALLAFRVTLSVNAKNTHIENPGFKNKIGCGPDWNELKEWMEENNQENGWALIGLHKSLLMQKKNAEAAKVMARFKKAFSQADIKIVSPVY